MASKIAIFGATGMTGVCCVQAAAQKGLTVTALVRNPDLVPAELADKMTMVKGDVTVAEDVTQAVKGQDWILVVLGTRNDLKPTTVMSDGLKNILEAMHQEGIKKITVCLSGFLFWEPERVPARFHEINAEHKRMLNLLQDPANASLDWVAVLPPHIADYPAKEKPYLVSIGKGSGRQISKWELGEFLVNCVENPEYKHQQVGLATHPDCVPPMPQFH